jgi:hypothetical protein
MSRLTMLMDNFAQMKSAAAVGELVAWAMING